MRIQASHSDAFMVAAKTITNAERSCRWADISSRHGEESAETLQTKRATFIPRLTEKASSGNGL